MQFRLLGPLDVLDGERALGITARRERAILLRLLLEPGRPIDPDRLIDDVWGDDPPADGRGSLRVLVSRLRRRLEVDEEHRILTGPVGYELRLSVDDEVDTARFDSLVGRARDELARGEAAAAATSLRDALDLWRGPPLGDLAELDFARPEAVRLHEAQLAALEARIEADLACGRHADLVGELEALCGAHPLREGLWAHRMVALYRSGRQAEALRAYQELRQVLAEEVGLDPTPALSRLEATMLAGELPEAPPPARPSETRTRAPGHAAALERTAFVGRVEELEALEQAWATARAGERRVVLLRGEAGAGKTRLAERLAELVAGDGGLVLEGRFDEEMLLPYQGFVEAVRRLRADHPEAASPDTWAALERLLPGAGAPPDAVLAGHGAGELERYRLFSAIESALDQAATTTPALLVLDDLQWADAPSLVLLKEVVRSRTPVPLLIVGTYRSTEVDEEHPLTPVLAQLHRARNVEALEVGELQVSDLAELAQALLGIGDVEAAAVAAAVAERTDGHALFSEGLIGAMAEPRLDPVSRQALDVPTTVREFVASCVSRLSRPARSMLAVAATSGNRFRVASALAATDLDDHQALDGLEECARTRLLLDDAAPGMLRFTHNLVRDVVYDNLPLVRRSHLHQAVADAMEAEPAGAVDERSAEIVRHLALAPETAANLRRQVDHACRAGAASMGKLAYEAAAEVFLHAVGAHTRLDGPPLERAELLVRAAKPMLLTGRPGVATERCRDAIELAVSEGDPLLHARAALLLEEASWTGYGFNQPAEAAAVATVLQRAIAALEGLADEEALALRAELLTRLPRVLHFGASPDERLGPAEEAVRLAGASGQARLRGAALEGLRWALWGGPDIQRLAEVSEQVVPEAQEAGDRALEVRGQVWRYLARLDLGDLVGAREAVGALRALATALPEPLALWYPEAAGSALALLEGRVDEAEAAALASFGVARRFELGWAVESFGIQLHQIRREQMRLGELEDATLAVAAAHTSEPVWQLAVADLHLQLGRPDRARAMLEDVADAITHLPQDLSWMGAIALAADLCVTLAHEPLAEVLYPTLAPHADRVVVIGPGLACLGSAGQLAGALAGLVGDWDAAHAHLDDALRVNASLGAVPFVVRTRLARAGLHARRGETAPAAAELTAARELAAALPNPLLLADCARVADA